MRVEAQACAECLEVYPKQKPYYLKGGLVCQNCRKENAEMKRQQTLTTKRDKTVLSVLGMLEKSRNTETDQKLLEAFYIQFDGLEGFAESTKRVFDNAKPGSQAQVQIVRAIIGLQQSVSAHTEAPDMSQWSDQELWSTVREVSEQMLRRTAEKVIDVEPGQYPALEEDPEAGSAPTGSGRADGGDGGTGAEESGEPEAL
jgi:hypothetical protein